MVLTTDHKLLLFSGAGSQAVDAIAHHAPPPLWIQVPVALEIRPTLAPALHSRFTILITQIYGSFDARALSANIFAAASRTASSAYAMRSASAATQSARALKPGRIRVA